jgi:gliding motility-associated-like protein
MKICVCLCFILSLLFLNTTTAQDVSLFKQFNGRYDYTAIGNTLNLQENGPLTNCEILTSSSAQLNLNEGDTIVAAYLYWAGSGSGDFEVLLNDIPIMADRTFSDALDTNRVFFAAFSDVTNLVKDLGNTEYTLSDLDLSDIIGSYCPTGTNFAGWAIAIVYENSNLPLNQLNIYDGLESVPDQLTINLTNLNVLDNENAKIGFIAWEGDSSLAISEQLSINGNVLSNPPLNPENNAFNGTNSFTAQANLFNMDLDVYNIQNNISIGDSEASISLTSGQDFVMINTIVTVLNSQLPDATINLDDAEVVCDDRTITIHYTVSNLNSTETLPANVPISFYVDDQLIGQSETATEIPIGGSTSMSTSLVIPGLETLIELTARVDDIGDGTGIITEINEDNNESRITFELLIIPEIIPLEDLKACNLGFEIGSFDLYDAVPEDFETPIANLSFYTSEEDARLGEQAITDPQNYQNTENPDVIFMRAEISPCFVLYSFQIEVENCPPVIPEGFSPNNDGKNDFFNIRGLYDIFINHQLLVYNRNGSLIFTGNNETKWDGSINKGTGGQGNKVPVGTYYYVLKLNDPEYRPIAGWVYVNY